MTRLKFNKKSVSALRLNGRNVKDLKIGFPQEAEHDILYRIGLLSDTHVDGDGDDTAASISDLHHALQFFVDQGIKDVVICGDITEDGRSYDYTAFANVIKDYSLNLLTITGNHDAQVDLTKVTGKDLYYEYKLDDNNICLFIGTIGYDIVNPFEDGELEWLASKLEQYQNKRVFLFCHYYADPVGDVQGITSHGLQYEGQALEFRNLMNTYKDNVIYFSGHSHLSYRLQDYGYNANFSEKTFNMCARVHIPSNGRPRKWVDGSAHSEYIGSECGILNIYDTYIKIQGYDLALNEEIELINNRINV